MKVLLVCVGMATFKQIDLDILRSAFETECVVVERGSPGRFAATMAKAALAARRADVVIAWFGAYQALMPFVIAKLRGRKCVVIASGHDTANEPEIDYGNMRPGPLRWIGRAVFSMADKVLAVSEQARVDSMVNALVPSERIEVIPHGIPEVSLVTEDDKQIEKRNQVLTVGHIAQHTLGRKGFNTFVRSAAMLPETSFLLVGRHEDDAIDELRRIAPENLQIPGALGDGELKRAMQESKVYAQLSRHEAFGMALAEAMALECIPVTTACGAIPEVVGDVGIRVPYGDVAATAVAIRRALEMSDEEGRRARRRILEEYSLERRKSALIDAIRKVWSDGLEEARQ